MYVETYIYDRRVLVPVVICRLLADGRFAGEFETWNEAAQRADVLRMRGEAVACRIEPIREN